MTAKDDSFNMMPSVQHNQNSKLEKMDDESPMKMNVDFKKSFNEVKNESVFQIDRNTRASQNQTKSRKRKMSATPTREDPKQSGLIIEEENEDWELA